MRTCRNGSGAAPLLDPLLPLTVPLAPTFTLTIRLFGPLQRKPRTKLYTLNCPKCDRPLNNNLWYLSDYPENGDDGLYCCSICIEKFKARTNTRSDQWDYFASKLDYNKEGPKTCWDGAKAISEEFVLANRSDEESENSSEVSFCSDDTVGGGG